MSTPVLVHSMKEYLPVTQRWIYETIRMLRPHFRQVIRTFHWVEGSPTFDDVPVIRERPTRWRRWWIRRMGTDWWGRRRLPDRALLFSHFGPQGYHDLALRIHPHWVRFYGFDLAALPTRQLQWRPLYQELFRKADVLVVEGPAMRTRLAETGAPAEKIHILPIGIQPPPYREIRRWESPPLRVLLPHAVREKKGVREAMIGLGTWRRRRRIPLEIHLVGDPPSDFDRPYWRRVQEEIARWGLADVLMHHGFLPFDRLLAVARTCHVAIHASRTTPDGDTEGGYPHVIPTLMATGLPFIASRHADIPFVMDSESGWLVPEGNPEAIAEALDEVIGASLEAKSRAAVHQARRFYWERLAPQYAAALRS